MKKMFLFLMVLMIAFCLPAMAFEKCDNITTQVAAEWPDCTTPIVAIEQSMPVMLSTQITGLSQSATKSQAQSEQPYLIDSPMVATLPRSPGVLLACSCSVGQSGHISYNASKGSTYPGAITYRHEDPGRQLIA